jgi:hypothetical protein
MIRQESSHEAPARNHRLLLSLEQAEESLAFGPLPHLWVD